MPVMAIIVFYTLCLLYVLSTATFVGDLVVATLQVSNNPICKNINFLSVAQWHISTLSSQLQTDLLPILIRLSIFKVVVIGCSDFIAQCILVCTNHHCAYHPFYSPKSSKIYRCWIVWGQNIRVVIIPSFLAITYLGQSISGYLHLISRFQFIASTTSYLASAKWCSNICTRPIFESCLGGHGDSNKLPFVHGREYPGDRLDRVQDPQGVLGRRRSFGRANFGLNREYQTSAYHIHYNWIRYGVVCHPTGSPRACHPGSTAWLGVRYSEC